MLLGSTNFLWLLEQGTSVIVAIAPVTVVLAFLILASLFTVPRQVLPTARMLRALWPLAGALLIVALGSVLGGAKGSAGDSLLVVLALQILLSTVLLIRTPGMRWFLGGVFALELWWSLCMAFVAGMSIADDWI